MDFKERFKGRTTTMKKEGFIETFETPANPVMKSQVNFQLQSASKIPSAAATGFSNNTVSQYRQFNPSPVENKELPYPPQSYSKGFAGPPQINPVNSTQQNMMLTNNLAAKNPYLVSNPFPSLDMPNYQGNNGNNIFRESRQAQKPAFQPSVQQSLQGTGFNPESFYNQHSQFKNNINGPMVHQSTEAQPHNPMFSTNLLAKKNFENLTQQNKQKRLAEEALRGFENQNPRFQTPNTRYEGQNNAAMSNYNNFYDKPPMYNGNRDSYSNPPPHQHLEENAFGYVPGNIHYQPAGQNQSGHNSFYSRASPEGMKTGFSNSSYKPYSLKDYKVIKEKDGVQLGGLGSNTGTDEWQKVKEKRDKMLEFSQNVKLFNAQRTSGSEYNFKPRREKEKSPSKRDVALEFAKNVPKPKQQRREASPEQKSPELKARKAQSDIVSYKRAESDVTYRPAMMHNDVHNELAEYEQRHNHYRAQLEKLKLA